jgi:hypothetical protein
MNELEDSFAKLLGRQPIDAELIRGIVFLVFGHRRKLRHIQFTVTATGNILRTARSSHGVSQTGITNFIRGN